MNEQPISKRIVDDGAVLQVHSIFASIQGEGPFTGHPAVFIRLAGCNLQCPSCDTDYTSSDWRATPQQLREYVDEMRQGATFVVITGGEPFRQNIHPLVQKLISFGFTVQIETNGTFPPPTIGFPELCSLNLAERNKCFVVCSPKTGRVHPLIEMLTCAYKYVVSADSIDTDGLPIFVLNSGVRVARPHPDFAGPIYLQPCDSKDALINQTNLHACINSVVQHGHILQLQLHKIVGVE